MSWFVSYTKEAEKDFDSLDSSQKLVVMRTVQKVSQNPLPINERGYGKPQGNKGGFNLTGYLKIKLKSQGLRVIYRLVRTEKIMRIVVIGVRNEAEAYNTAYKRIKANKI